MDTELNVEKTDQIDSVAYNKRQKMLILQLNDGMDWSDKERHIKLLREKLVNYVWYVNEEEYAYKYPEVDRIELRVSFLYKEPPDCMFTLQATASRRKSKETMKSS